MKILSFDVGIKNLAACILEWNDDSKINSKQNLKIHYWNIINLLTSQVASDVVINNFKCCITTSKGIECDKKAKSFTEFNGSKYCFCTKHLASKDEFMNQLLEKYDQTNWYKEKGKICSECVKTIESEQPTEQPTTQSDTIQNIFNQVTGKPDRKFYNVNDELNCTLCSKHYNSLMAKIETARNKVHPIKNKKVKDMTTDDLKYQLVKCLDERKQDLLQTEMVLIENQPTFKNPTMKAISDTLYTWFMIRGVVDKDINNSQIKKIKFISPSNKLKEFDQKAIEEADESKKYKETKKLSVENTKTILQSYGLKQWIDELMKHQKKDDLADSFLQGWYVLNNMNDDKLYNEWKNLYNDTVFKVSDLVEEKKAKKKNGLKIKLGSEEQSNDVLENKENKENKKDKINDNIVMTQTKSTKTKSTKTKSTKTKPTETKSKNESNTKLSKIKQDDILDV
jgi:hypothetical protein